MLLARHDTPVGFHLDGVPAVDFDGLHSSMLIEPALANPSVAVSQEQAIATANQNHPWRGEIRQAVLVQLTDKAKDPPERTLAWAVNFDPATIVGWGPPSCGPAGHRCASAYDLFYSLVFVDANSGNFIFGADSGHERAGQDEDSAHKQLRLSVANIDGPPVRVVPFDGADALTLACGEGRQITDGPDLPWHLTVSNAWTGEVMLDHTIEAGTDEDTLLIRRDGVLIGHDGSGGPAPVGCPSP